MKDLSWKHVIIACAFLGCLTVVVLSGVDSGPVIMVGMAILAGIGWAGTKATEAKAETTAVREQTNGNTTRMLQMLEGMAHQMASMQPLPPAGDAEEKPSGEWPVISSS